MKKIVRIIVGGVFILSAVSKLFSMESFELYIFSFGFAGFDICAIAARVLIIAEFIIGICMAFVCMLVSSMHPFRTRIGILFYYVS